MARLGRRGFLAACTGVLVTGCSGREPAGTGNDAADAPRDPSQTTATRARAGDVKTCWATFIPGRYTLAAPAVADEALYLGSREEMRALALGDGTVQWEVSLGGLTHPFTPTVANGVVYAGARDMVGRSLLTDGPGVVAALGVPDGSEQWRADLRITGSPTVAGDALLVPTTHERPAIHALATADGSERWHAPLHDTGEAFARPVVTDSLALAGTVGDNGGHMSAIDISDGSKIWMIDPDGNVHAPPAVNDGVAYLATDAGELRALAVTDGAERWRVNLGGPVRTSPVVSDETLYVAVGDTVLALAVTDGSKRWDATVGSVNRTGLAVGDMSVYSGGDQISALAVADGYKRWVQHLEGMAGTFGAPVYRDGVLYTGACIKQDGDDPYDHHVYALAETG